MQLKDFQEMINQTIFCVSSKKNEAGKEIFGVYMEKNKGKLVIAATDEKKLGFSSRFIGDDFPDFQGLFLPAGVLRKISRRKRNDETLSISITGTEFEPSGRPENSDKKVNFHIGSACIPSKIISKEYFHLFSAEDIAKLFPCIVPVKVMGQFFQSYRDTEKFNQRLPLSFTVDRTALVNSLKIVSVIMEPWRLFTVELDITPGNLALHTGDSEATADDEIPCDYSGDKRPLRLYAKYFTEIVEQIKTERVKIMFNKGKNTIAVLPVPEQDIYYFLNQVIGG